jgi:hypothetical protein
VGRLRSLKRMYDPERRLRLYAPIGVEADGNREKDEL